MQLTAENFKSLFPEFTAYDDKRIEFFFSFNANKLSQNYFKYDFELAVFYISAHQMLCADRGSKAKNALTSETVGPVTESYQTITATNNDQYYLSTVYGVEYLRLKKEHASMNWIVL
ncbi:DUF4054 domain-containing protein [Fluviispira vulneris]|uniref:DUF4054 domain-containing protein n=1 Tax=Fluviispira vulneris TaxID=2763012 RepID=UPI001646DC97|nr:DUF4054 domain-containing protein [Fluviispira vulneris]